jgi:hypothetical protein
MTEKGPKGIWKMMLKGMMAKKELMTGNTGSSWKVKLTAGKDKGSKKDT